MHCGGKPMNIITIIFIYIVDFYKFFLKEIVLFVTFILNKSLNSFFVLINLYTEINLIKELALFKENTIDKIKNMNILIKY